jgi:Protein of unknown function (DUF2914)
MSNKRKLNVGPLPSQDKDYSVYEKTEILWGRISLVFVLVVALVFGFFNTLFGVDKDAPQFISVIEKRQLETAKQAESSGQLSDSEAGQVLTASALAEQPEPKVASVEIAKPLSTDNLSLDLSSAKSPETISDSSPEPSPEIISDSSSVLLPASSEPSDSPQSQTVVLNSRADVNLVSPVTTLHAGISEAVLSSNVDRESKPVDTLGYEVFMNGQDLIKVVLYTDMNALSGHKLKHQWVLGDKVFATVKIPVRSDSQQSYSSKFIDRYMVGEWTVNVLDQNDELYARANFVVKE